MVKRLTVDQYMASSILPAGTKKKKWNRCDVCGKFIPFKHFEKNMASRVLIFPDSYVTVETYETLCKKHNEREVENWDRV